VASLNRAIQELAFSPDSRYLASNDWAGNVEIFDRDQQQIVFNEQAHQQVGQGLAFSPDGRTLATATTDGQIKFWHVPTMMQVTSFDTGGRVSELAFFPDGKTLAVGYLDRTVELWHVDREKEHFRIDAANQQ
jgi:WD40 repeat protein